MKKIISCALSLFLISLICTAQLQVPAELLNKLQGKTRMNDIWPTINDYFKEQKRLAASDTKKLEDLERQLKKWNRWHWYNEGRLDANGEITNINERTWQVAKNIHDTIPAGIPSGTENAYGSWSLVGPSNMTIGSSNSKGIGRVDRIAFHPSNSNIIYAGTPCGGLFKSTDAGSSWSPVSSYIPSLGISGIVVSNADPNNDIYVLTGGGDDAIQGGFTVQFGYYRTSVGVLKTTDGGTTWQQTGTFPVTGTFTGYELAQDPNNASVLFAATSKGLFFKLSFEVF